MTQKQGPKGRQRPITVGMHAPWLDQGYIPFSKKWSPHGYDLFHEATGLWLLSAVAAYLARSGKGSQLHLAGRGQLMT